MTLKLEPTRRPLPPFAWGPTRGGLIARLKTWYKDRARRRAAYYKTLGQFDELLSMPNHMLSDLGLTRDMVRQERTRFFYTGTWTNGEPIGRR